MQFVLLFRRAWDLNTQIYPSKCQGPVKKISSVLNWYPAATQLEFCTKVDQAAEAGEQFSKLYYETTDKKRHLLQKLYLDSATVVWNGNAVKGLEEIIKFYDTIPTSEHNLDSLDCQPLTDQISGGQMTICVKTLGTVKYDKSKPKIFHQNFILTSVSNVWKIVSDSFRFQE